MLDFAEPVPRRLRKLFSPEAPPIRGVGFIALAASLLRTTRFISFFLDVFWGRLAPGSGARKVKLGGMLSGAWLRTANSSGDCLFCPNIDRTSPQPVKKARRSVTESTLKRALNFIFFWRCNFISRKFYVLCLLNTKFS